MKPLDDSGAWTGSKISGNTRLIAKPELLHRSHPSQPAHLIPRDPHSWQRPSPGKVNRTWPLWSQDGNSVPCPSTVQAQHQRPAAGIRLHPDICGKGGIEPFCFEVRARGTIGRVIGSEETMTVVLKPRSSCKEMQSIGSSGCWVQQSVGIAICG